MELLIHENWNRQRSVIGCELFSYLQKSLEASAFNKSLLRQPIMIDGREEHTGGYESGPSLHVIGGIEAPFQEGPSTSCIVLRSFDNPEMGRSTPRFRGIPVC